MNHIDTIPPILTSPPAPLSKLEPARRLIVLIPSLESIHFPAIRRIWELATAQHAHVLLLSLCKNPAQEPSLRRDLIAMSAMVQDGGVRVEVHVEIAANWMEAVKRNYQAGDMIVCFAEQRAGFLHKPLSQILQSDLKIPVYILSGLYLPKPKSNLLSQIMAWLGSAGIIVAFFVLQVHIIQVSKGGLQNILLILSIIPEFWLMLFWNSRFG